MAEMAAKLAGHPKRSAILVETAAQPLYEAVSRAESADAVAEACLRIASEAAEHTELSGDAAIAQAGLRLVAAESLTQIGLVEDAKKDAEAALKVLAEALGDRSYYVARTRCLLSRISALYGDRQAALDQLDACNAAVEGPMADAPLEADAWLLRAFIGNGRASIMSPKDAVAHFVTARAHADEAVKSAKAGMAEESAGAADELRPPTNAEQTLFVSLTMRCTIIVDLAAAQLRQGEFDAALQTLDDAEAAAKELPSFVEGNDHPALADIDYHRACALASKGQLLEAAAKAGVAYRILAQTLPMAVDKLAAMREMEANCLSHLGEGGRAVMELDGTLQHIDEVAQTGRVDPAAVGLARRKTLLTKLSILDNRSEYDAVLKLFDKGLLEALQEASPEGRMFAVSRQAQSLALRGKPDEALALFDEVLAQAPEVVPERVPDIKLSASFIKMGAGDEAGASAMRDQALEAFRENGADTQLSAGEYVEWLCSAASVAAEMGNKARATELLKKAEGATDDKDVGILAAPIYHQVGAHDEANRIASETLRKADVVLEKKDDNKVDVDGRYGEVIAISCLERIRSGEASTDDARSRLARTVRAVVELLRKDARHRVAGQLESDLVSLVGTEKAEPEAAA